MEKFRLSLLCANELGKFGVLELVQVNKVAPALRVINILLAILLLSSPTDPTVGTSKFKIKSVVGGWLPGGVPVGG